VYPAIPHHAGDLAAEFKSSGDEPLRDQLVACTSCGLQYVSPRLRPQLILDGYREGTDERFVSQAAARERTFARSLAVIERYARGRGRLFDVGTAAGSFLHAARQRGWTVSGCEPNRWMCEWGREHYGLTIHAGTLFEHPQPDAHFDVVTVWDVLEHVPDPRQFLRECHRIVKPGGLLVVNYPDIGSWIARAMRRRWVFLLSVHLYYFTRATIREALQRTGFTVEHIQPHFQRLELDYVLERGEPLVGPLARLGRRMFRAGGLGKVQVPYWIGQTLVVARRR
jgi:2-polyprenyl-3-methyl-5-hydroxy-6-metoxy-1,4-benzoquinol methylase